MPIGHRWVRTRSLHVLLLLRTWWIPEVTFRCRRLRRPPRARLEVEGKFTLLQAVGFNTMNLFGTGPLFTVPYCLAQVDPMGPHAMRGYGVACIA